MYGISSQQWKVIFSIFLWHKDLINWVKLFGSRARGDGRVTSDVDLAVSVKDGATLSLIEAFEDSSLPYTFDIIDYDRQSNENLKKEIDRDGKLLFSVKGGRSIMTDTQLRLKWEDYHRAMDSLRIAVKWERDADNMYLDATIQRFEFCFELAWKLMKSALAYEGIEASSPRSSIREGWKQGLIDSAEKWLDMLEKRNLSSHTYNETTAMDVYNCIIGEYLDLLSALENKIKERI